MASFDSLEGGGYKCKLCQKKIPTQSGCADHLLKAHRTMASADKHKMCSCKACMSARGKKRMEKLRARRGEDKVKAGQFSPADRLQMPSKAGTTQKTIGPGMVTGLTSGLIRQRPGGPKRKVGNAMRGSQIAI